MAYFIRLMRDARLEGLNARFFGEPLSRMQWRWLLWCCAFHVVIFFGGLLIFIFASGSGRLLLAFEATLRLSAARNRVTRTPCSDTEKFTELAIVLACLLAGGVTSAILRYTGQRQYAGMWARGVGVPALLYGLVAQFMFNSCIDQNFPQELVSDPLRTISSLTFTVPGLNCACGNALSAMHPLCHAPPSLQRLYIALTCTGGIALVWTSALAYRRPAKERWMYVALLPYYAVGTLGSYSCLSWFVDHGGYGHDCLLGHMNQDPKTCKTGAILDVDLATKWGQDPRPTSVYLVFFSLILVYLAALFSLLFHDPDEASEELMLGLTVISGTQATRERVARRLRRMRAVRCCLWLRRLMTSCARRAYATVMRRWDQLRASRKGGRAAGVNAEVKMQRAPCTPQARPQVDGLDDVPKGSCLRDSLSSAPGTSTRLSVVPGLPAVLAVPIAPNP